MSDHPNDVHMADLVDDEVVASAEELDITDVEHLNLTDDAKVGGPGSDDETGSTVTIGEVGVDEYFDEAFCDDSIVDTTDYREATAAAAANLLPVFINFMGDDNNAPGAAVAEYQDKLTDIIRSAHTLIAKPADRQTQASTSAARRPLCVVIPREAAIAASQALVKFNPKRKRSGDSNRPERTFLLPGYIDANQSIRKSCKDYGLNLPELAYDAINLDEHLIRNCYMSILPAKPTIDEILEGYVKNKNANLDMYHFLKIAFDEILPIWCLRRIETLKHEEIVKKYPGRRLCTIYGLIHFLRFSMYLPRLFSRLEFHIVVERATRFHPVVEFLNGFFEYMVEKGLQIDVNQDYDIMLPSYYKMAYDVLHKTYPTEPSIVLE